jgi:hypothetical protein
MGPGREEEFIGTLLSYFPLDTESELNYLRRDWSHFGLLWTRQIVGYDCETAPEQMDEGERREHELGTRPSAESQCL